MTQRASVTVPGARFGLAGRARRLAGRSMIALGLIAGCTGCILTQDIPDPALDVPQGYKAARLEQPGDALPTLDWWRGFRSKELTQLMEEAQTVNLDIAAAVARFRQADALARQAGAALLPSVNLNGSENYSRTSGSSASGLSIGGREVVNYSASLSASYQLDFWGQNRDALQAAEETSVANRFDREVVALTTLVSVALVAGLAVFSGITLLLFFEDFAAAAFLGAFTDALARPLVALRATTAAFFVVFEALFLRVFCDTACARKLPRPCSMLREPRSHKVRMAGGSWPVMCPI